MKSVPFCTAFEEVCLQTSVTLGVTTTSGAHMSQLCLERVAELWEELVTFYSPFPISSPSPKIVCGSRIDVKYKFWSGWRPFRAFTVTENRSQKVHWTEFSRKSVHLTQASPGEAADPGRPPTHPQGLAWGQYSSSLTQILVHWWMFWRSSIRYKRATVRWSKLFSPTSWSLGRSTVSPHTMD